MSQEQQQKDDEGPCPTCDRLETELDAFLKTLEAGVTQEAVHKDWARWTPRANVTAVLLAVTLRRLIEEVGNPFAVMSILARRVMSMVDIEIVPMVIGGGGPAPSGADISDQELMSMDPSKLGQA